MRSTVKIFFTGAVFVLLMPVVTLSAAVHLPKTGQIKCYDDWNTEIACSGTGQDGEIQAGIASPTPRFHDNGDGTVRDTQTGLVWLKDANCLATNYPGFDKDETAGDGAVTWGHALAFIDGVNGGIYPICGAGKTDWRLANVNEMESLFGYENAILTNSDWLQTQGFNNVQTKLYWTSTSYAEYGTHAWDVDLELCTVVFDGKQYGHHVWPVRGGQKGNSDGSFPANVWKTGQTTPLKPGDDGTLMRGVDWPSPRFIDNKDGTVTDVLTSLMWLKDADCMATQYPSFDKDGTAGNGDVTWQHALDFVAGINSGTYPKCGAGYADWRLANKKEAHSLTDFSRFNPALPSGHPFTNVHLLYYWTNTNASDTREAFYLDMGDGEITMDFKTALGHVFPVRGGCVGTSDMTAPTGHDLFVYPPTPSPVVCSEAKLQRPAGAGKVVVGGNAVDLQVATWGFGFAVDVYLAFYWPAMDSKNVYLLKSDKTFHRIAKGLVKWKSGVTASIAESLFGEVPATWFPAGVYYIYVIVTPAGSPSAYYIWQTSFVIP